MASVWLARDEDGGLLGIFTSRDRAMERIHPIAIELGHCYLTEEPVDAVKAQPGEIYGPVYSAEIDLDTGIPVDREPVAWCRFRPNHEPDDGHVGVYRDHASVTGWSARSHESALATAHRLRDEYLASGKPTRDPVEWVQPVGDMSPYLGKSFQWKPREVAPGSKRISRNPTPFRGGRNAC